MKKSLSIYNLQPNETIASIGASSGVWEIWFASQVEGLTFYLQDIDPLNCNQEEINDGVTYFEKLVGKKNTGKFIPIIGTQSATNLPQNTFDKVLIINSLHEFKSPTVILQDIHKILKTNGRLFIEEQLAKFSDEIHEGCGKRLFTENELSEILEKCCFQLIEKHFKDDGIVIFETKHLEITTL
jgi:ubiquinone/menaquinone biosynthesis C-methylase UbiE